VLSSRGLCDQRHAYRTRIITDGVEPSLHIDYKHSHLKQYFKEGRGLRTELTINNPNDFDVRIALALRLADPRVLAVLQALCGCAHLPAGFRHRDLRPRIAALLGRPYSAGQMTYDLRRLRLRGLIERRSRTHAYVLTSYGRLVPFFYSKLYGRILRPHAPVLAHATDALPRPLRSALEQLDAAIERIYQEAALAA
jgi:hypothetical protein